MIHYMIMCMFFTIHVVFCSSNKTYFQESIFPYQKCITLDYADVIFFKNHSANAKEKRINFLRMPQVWSALGHMLRYDSVEDGLFEKSLIKKSKYEFIEQAQSNSIEIPITPSDALLLKYWDKDISSWKREYLRFIFKSNLFNITSQHSFFYADTLKKPEILVFLNRIVKAENNILLHGKRVIYHATNKELYILMKIQALILEYKNKQKYPNFLPLRNPALSDYVSNQDHEMLRQKFLKEGTTNDHQPQEKYHLLSGNHSIFSNLDSKFTGESALQFLIARWNVNPPKLLFKFELRNIFIQNGMRDFYESNKKALKSLILDGTYGILLRLEFDPDLFEKTCYFSAPYGGYALPVAVRNEHYTANNYMDKVIKYPATIDTLDTIQLRVVLDHDLLLNPDNKETQEKFKITALTVNQKSLDNFNREITKLFDNYRY